MIKEYSYEKAMEICDLFNNQQIAFLNISNINGTYFFDFTLVEDYQEPLVSEIRNNLTKCLPERIAVLNSIHTFIKAMQTKTLNTYSLKFSAMNYPIVFKESATFLHPSISQSITEKDLVLALDNLELIVTKLGCSEQKISDFYTKETGVGKKPKLNTVTIGQILKQLRTDLNK